MAKVSVIIPTYNRERLISRAIESVLKQTYTDYEIIVVDDGSTDRTSELLKKFEGRIRYFYQQNSGISGARNRGLEEAKGEYIAFLDSDDAWLPEKLTIQVEVLDKNKDVGIIYSKMLILNEAGKHCGFKPDEKTGRDFLELIEIRGDIATSTVMSRRECFEKVGRFDPDLPPMEDFDMWLRISKFYKVYEVENITLAYYYQHSQQATCNPKKVYEGLVKLERKILKMAADVPSPIKQKVIQRLTMHQYTLSRLYYKEGRLNDAFENVTGSIAQNTSVGLTFCNERDNLLGRLIKFCKPYGFWAVCWMKLKTKGPNA
jgi:glycosyltransferase involved in cell wall biosynthesis